MEIKRIPFRHKTKSFCHHDGGPALAQVALRTLKSPSSDVPKTRLDVILNSLIKLTLLEQRS